MPSVDKFIERCNKNGVTYVSSNEKRNSKNKNWTITYYCEIHGNIETTWESLRKVNGCKECNREKANNDKRVNLNTVKELFNSKGYVLLVDTYKRSIDPLSFLCPSHPDKETSISYNNLQRGHGCKFCYYESRVLYQDSDIFEILARKKYSFEGFLFLNNFKYVEYKCSIHNTQVQKISIYNLLKGQGCKHCASESLSLQFRESYEKVSEVFKYKGYLLITKEYKNNNQMLSFICLKHSQLGIQQSTYSNVKNKTGCKGCANLNISKGRSKSHEKFLKDAYDLVGSDYEILSTYKNNKTKILIQHKLCNYIYETTPKLFLRGSRCPNCNRSRGELKILSILEKMDIKFIPEYRISACRNIFPLPFDFAVFNEDRLHFLIEYQGRQHYTPSDFFGGEEAFVKRKINDNIKKRYCESNNIPLIEIPYWDYEKIELILKKEITKLT